MITLIPAIDIIEGKCVRLTQGDYNRQTVYNASPVDVAHAFEDIGCRKLHLVDLDGAKASHIVNYNVLERIASKTGMEIDFGGGVKSDDDIRIALECGANKVTAGSIAIKEPETFKRWLVVYGNKVLILGADVRDKKIAINGWHEDSGVDIMEFIGNYAKDGVSQVICTDIGRDGMLEGPAIELYKEIIDTYDDLQLIASGGVGTMRHIADLERIGIENVIVGKAIYEGTVSLKEVERLNMTGTCLQNE